MTVTTIIVVTVLTLLIFILTLVAFSSTIKYEKKEIEAGNRDTDITKYLESEKKKSAKVSNLLLNILSWIIAAAVAATLIVAIVYRTSDKKITINNHTVLVIASDSMSKFYNTSYESSFKNIDNQQILYDDVVASQFDIGDILDFCIVTETEALTPYKVYGYKSKDNKIITHRFLGYTTDGKCVFRGDNTTGRDNYVNRSQVILEYSGYKITRIGLFILFAQSGFGIYSLTSALLVYFIADIYWNKYYKIIIAYDNNRKKLVESRLASDIVFPAAAIQKKKLVQFKTKDGKVIRFYATKK